MKIQIRFSFQNRKNLKIIEAQNSYYPKNKQFTFSPNFYLRSEQDSDS
jgi:hypothetical protein